MLTAFFVALLLAPPAAPAALRDHLLATATIDVDLDGQPDEVRILAPEAELHTGEAMCEGCPPEDFVAGRFVVDVKLAKSGQTIRSPLVFAPEEPEWSLERYGRPGAREVLRFPYRKEPAQLDIQHSSIPTHFNLVQFLGADDSQYSLFMFKSDGTIVRLEEDPDTITTDGDVLAESRLQRVWEKPGAPPPAEPRPICRWDEIVSKQHVAGMLPSAE